MWIAMTMATVSTLTTLRAILRVGLSGIFTCRMLIWNVIALRQGSDIVERYEYDPYGNVRIFAGYDPLEGHEDLTVIGDSVVDNPFLFAGYFYDSETGLYHVRHRMYSPILQRWLQRDPAGYVDGMNLYQYVRANPLTNTDPSGLAEHPPLAQIQVTIVPAGRGMIGTLIQVRVDRNACCKEVRFVQIVKETYVYALGIWTTVTDWEIDSDRRNMPWYPLTLTFGPWRVGRYDWWTLHDMPGHNWSTWSVRFFRQDFETCAVCIREHVSALPGLADGTGETVTIRSGCVLGCVKWGQLWRAKPPIHWWYGGRNFGPGDPPSKQMRTLVLEGYKFDPKELAGPIRTTCD